MTQFKMAAAASRVQRRCARTVVWGDLEREQRSCTCQARAPPPSATEAIHLKQPRPRLAFLGRACALERELASPFFDRRIKISFASEPNWVSFYWHE